MTAREWPNKLGWDVGQFEVMKLSQGLKVSSLYRFALVGSTADPIDAVRLCAKHGLMQSDLESMDPLIADDVVRSHKL